MQGDIGWLDDILLVQGLLVVINNAWFIELSEISHGGPHAQMKDDS